MKKEKKHLGLITAVFLIVAVIFAGAFAATEDELNDRKDAAEEARDAAQYQVDMTQNTLDGISAEIEKADIAITKIKTQIQNLNDEISVSNAELQELESRLEEAVQKKVQQENSLEERLRVMYMYGTESYFDLFFSAHDFSDLIERLELTMSVMDADRQVLQTLQDAQQKIEDRQAEVEAKKVSLAGQVAEQEELQQAQENIRAQQNELLAQNQAVLAEYQAAVAEQEAIIKEAETELARIAVQKNGGSSRAGTGTYIWPSDYYTITDYFGYRDQPCAGASTYHQGVDIGASYGSPIYASASGTVIQAGWNGGLGYCVMIAHDSGYTTVYGHQSSVAVYKGQSVAQGQVIGYVGSTGVSTGPHIHFAFINPSGTYVNPLDFV